MRLCWWMAAEGGSDLRVQHSGAEAHVLWSRLPNSGAGLPVLCSVHSVVSDSLGPRGLGPTRLLCPWDFPGKHTGVACCHSS